MRPESKQLIEIIRKIMKQRKLRLHHLASALDVSLPTAKRLVSGADLSLDRLLAICDWLNVPLGQLISMVEQDTGRVKTFTPEQENFFAENPPYLSYFWTLLSERMAPEEIETHYKLSRRSTRRYQSALEKLGLLTRLEGISVKLEREGGTYRWSDQGVLGKTYTKYFLSKIADRAIEQLEHPEDMETRTGGTWLTPEQRSELLREIDDLLKKQRIVSQTNRLSENPGDLRYTSYALLVDFWNDPFFEEIIEL